VTSRWKRLIFMGLVSLPGLAHAIPWANPRPVANPPAQDSYGLRLSGGYGFSLNSSVGQNPDGSFSLVPASQGIPSGAELYTVLRPGLQIGLGVFPDLITRNTPVNYFVSGASSSTPGTFTENITLLPVILSLTMKQPLGDGFGIFTSVGAGVLPATTDNTSTGNGTPGYSIQIDAGYAFRGVLGVDKQLMRRVSLGLAVQVLQMNAKTVGGAATQNFSQVAPMAVLDTHF
jgi:hypothetical protein